MSMLSEDLAMDGQSELVRWEVIDYTRLENATGQLSFGDFSLLV